MAGATQQGTSSLPGPTLIDLGDNIDDIHLFDVENLSLVFTRASSDPLYHSLHDQSLQVEVSVDTYDQQLQKGSSSVVETNISLR